MSVFDDFPSVALLIIEDSQAGQEEWMGQNGLAMGYRVELTSEHLEALKAGKVVVFDAGYYEYGIVISLKQ